MFNAHLAEAGLACSTSTEGVVRYIRTDHVHAGYDGNTWQRLY